MLRIFNWAMLLSLVSLTWAATPTAKKAPAKKGAPKKASFQSTGKKAPAKSVTWRNRQTAPTADRYREIQSALVTKGYLSSGEANGVWNQASIDALKKFQSDQNISSTGK